MSARANDVRAELADRFPKHIYHSIICIGALIAHREEDGHWIVDAIGAPHAGERSERELIASFVETKPRENVLTSHAWKALGRSD
jgi:hypothetical protein